MYGFGTIFNNYIDGFVFGTINNIGSGAQGGAAYSDYRYSGPGFITSAAPGGTYTATITSGPSGVFDEYAIWVDLDGDLNFEPGELLAQATVLNNGVQTTTLDVTIPANARTGYTTMRVMVADGSTPDVACGTYFNGETEDYTIVIDDGSACIPLYGAQASQGHYISEVHLADLAWGPVQVQPTGYTDALHNGAHVQSGATSTLTVFGGSAASGYLSAWVSWGNGFELIGSLPVGTGFAQVTFDITPDLYYVGYARMRVAHTDANVGVCDPSDFGNAVDFALSVERSGWPCLPLQGYGTQFGDGFTDMTIEGDAYAAQTEFPYYIAWSAMPYHYDAGGSITISFTAGSYAPETYRLSMDMNDDGDFFDTNEEPLIYTSTVAGEPITMVYPLPPNCIPGQHFVRLRANDDAGSPLVDPCDDQPYGQILDWVVVVEDPNGPCIPFMNQWTTDGDFIDGVQLGTIQNTGTGSVYGVAYQDYTAQSTTLIVGQPATLTITGGEYAGDTYSAWIDYNNDNDFDDAGESLGWALIADPFGTNDVAFTVPPGTTLGSKRMRVRCATSPMSNACLDASYGETEDYTVSINASTGVAAVATPDFLVLPTTDGVQLLSDAAFIGYTYTLFDATGRIMATGRITADRTDLPMLDFAHGAYTVQVHNGDARQVKRFVW
ncbi:MAG: T9SS type A sorting domain-containing protein [Flavobacteriales bacterium]|nr:T9SS type A sorting domain-containing protein [Flavobacteriales bacterium]